MENEKELSLQDQVNSLKSQLASLMGNGTKIDYTQKRTARLKIFNGKIATGLKEYPNGDKTKIDPVTGDLIYNLILKDLETDKEKPEEHSYKEMRMDNTNCVAVIKNGKVNKKGQLIMNQTDVDEKEETEGMVVKKKVNEDSIDILGEVPAVITKVEIEYELEIVDDKFPELKGKIIRVDSSALNM